LLPDERKERERGNRGGKGEERGKRSKEGLGELFFGGGGSGL